MADYIFKYDQSFLFLYKLIVLFNMKSFKQYLFEELHDVIVKVGDYWRIKGHAGKGTNTPKRGYWKAKYETKEKAENALKAYFANKG